MNKKLIKKIAFAGIMLGIVIVFQFIKNVSAFISGPVINTVMILVTLELGIWWGVGFSIGVPLLSLLIAPASPMTMMALATYGSVTVLVIIGNLIYALMATLAKDKKLIWFILLLISGAVLKWLAMWGGASLIIKPLFEAQLGKLVNAVNTVFSSLQLFSGLLSIILIVPLSKVLDKVYKKKEPIESK